MNNLISEMEKDLRSRLDHLCWMHNEPALHVAKHFAELRRQVDLDAERLIEEIQSSNGEVNSTRAEFIRILNELEKKIALQPKPKVPSSEHFASFEQRITSLKDSSRSREDLEESYIMLARELNDETERVEKRIFGEQTIIYCPFLKNDRLGSLLYFGDLYLSKRDIGCIHRIPQTSTKTANHVLERFETSILRRSRLNRAFMLRYILYPNIMSIYERFLADKINEHSKFYYVGKTERKYSGYSAEGASIQKEFISYKFNRSMYDLTSAGDVDFDTSTNLFDAYSSNICELNIEHLRLECLHPNLLPSPANRLRKLCFRQVHLESFDPTLLASCKNLNSLQLEVTFSKQVKFNLGFLKAMIRLERLELTLPHSTSDFSVLKNLPSLLYLTLRSCSASFAEPFVKLTRLGLQQILMAPRLHELKLYLFEIEAVEKTMLKRCSNLEVITFSSSRIGRIDRDAFGNLGSSTGSANICVIHSQVLNWSGLEGQNNIHWLHLEDIGLRTLNVSSFVGLTSIVFLVLSHNSINELPPGVFSSMTHLKELDLNYNLIRKIKRGSFDGPVKLKSLYMNENPIETIEANAFGQLDDLRCLYLEKCRLRSIDSEMFVGLVSLHTISLDDNLIERIEVVAEDGRRFDVAKPGLTDEERELIERRSFRNMPCFVRLQLKGNKLEKFNLGCLLNLRLLRELCLSSNRMSELTGRADKLLNLLELELADNCLETIDADALPDSLRVLNLTGNNLSRLTGDFWMKFESKCRFDQARFSQAKIRKLSRLDIESLSRSEELDFSGNHIEILDDPELFSNFRHVRVINLRENRLRSIHRDILRSQRELRAIDLSENKLSSVDLGLFRNLAYLSEINLSSNAISHLNFARLFRICRGLESLNLADNQLDDRSTAEPIDNTSLSKLKKLNLAGNRLESLNFIRDMTRLLDLDLRGNRIESVMSNNGENLLGRLSKLTHLDLSGNRITLLRDEMFAHLRGQLKHLDLSGNTHDFKLDSVLMELI